MIEETLLSIAGGVQQFEGVSDVSALHDTEGHD